MIAHASCVAALSRVAHRQYGLAAYPSRRDRFSKASPPTSKPPACRDASLCLRLQHGSSVRGWGLTSWGRGASSGGARAEGVDVAYALWRMGHDPDPVTLAAGIGVGVAGMSAAHHEPTTRT